MTGYLRRIALRSAPLSDAHRVLAPPPRAALPDPIVQPELPATDRAELATPPAPPAWPRAVAAAPLAPGPAPLRPEPPGQRPSPPEPAPHRASDPPPLAPPARHLPPPARPIEPAADREAPRRPPAPAAPREASSAVAGLVAQAHALAAPPTVERRSPADPLSPPERPAPRRHHPDSPTRVEPARRRGDGRPPSIRTDPLPDPAVAAALARMDALLGREPIERPVPPPLPPAPVAGPQVSIGRVRVEIVSEPQPAAAPQRPAPRVASRAAAPRSSLGPITSKLRFGLGQV